MKRCMVTNSSFLKRGLLVVVLMCSFVSFSQNQQQELETKISHLDSMTRVYNVEFVSIQSASFPDLSTNSKRFYFQHGFLVVEENPIRAYDMSKFLGYQISQGLFGRGYYMTLYFQ